jgi:hypothetical protein
MSVLEQYRQQAKILYPVELQIRKINEIKEKTKAGEHLTAEQYEKALKPVTSELVKTQDIIRELKSDKQQTSPIDDLSTAPLQWLLKSPPVVKHETPSISYIAPSSIDDFLNDKFTSAVLSRYNLPTPIEMLNRTNHENNTARLQRLKIISMQLGKRKAKSFGSERDEIDKQMDVIRKYRNLLKNEAPQEGTGLIYYKNAKDLIDRLDILMGQMRAGNDAVDIQNEALTILDKLLQQKKISNEDHEKLYEKIYSF